jgi:hypothetical protein
VCQQADFGLVGKGELVTLDSAPQLLFQSNPLAGLSGQIAGVMLDPVAPLGLRAVHRRVGILDQRGDVRAVCGKQRAADAGAHEELVIARLKRRRKTVEQLDGDDFGVGRILQARQQDDEFVATESRDGVDVAQVLLQAHRNAF